MTNELLKQIKAVATVYAKGGATLGVLDAYRIALHKGKSADECEKIDAAVRDAVAAAKYSKA